MAHDRPEFPIEQARAALPSDHAGQRQLDALHRELHSQHPRADAIKARVDELLTHSPIASMVANWFDDPRTQEFINELVQAGL